METDYDSDNENPPPELDSGALELEYSATDDQKL
jgi:hypothetical protein